MEVLGLLDFMQRGLVLPCLCQLAYQSVIESTIIDLVA